LLDPLGEFLGQSDAGCVAHMAEVYGIEIERLRRADTVG
jgi:hypothetical protein